MRLSNIALAVSAQYGGLFKPSSLFTTGVNGAWYDPSDFSTMFQDASGTTPVTAVGQPVGLMLDKSKGLVLGPELVTNGDFATDTAWTKATGVTISGGKANFSSVSTVDALYQNVGIVAGKRYKITASITGTGTVSPVFGGNTDDVNNRRGAGEAVWLLNATSEANGNFVFYAQSFTGTLDNISVRELPGNHAYNPSGNSANFPVLSARYNGLLATENLTSVSWFLGGAASRTATTFTATSSGDFLYQTCGGYLGSVATGVRFTASVELSGTGIITLAILSGSGSDIEAQQITLTSTPTRYSISATNTYTGSNIGVIFRGTGTLVSANLSKVDFRLTNDALNQPAYQRVNTATDYDTVGFKPYLRFNGVNQWLQTNSIDFSYGDKMFVSAGVRKLVDQIGMVAELSSSYDSISGSFGLTARSGSGNDIGWASRGTNVVPITFSVLAPVTAVVSGTGNISAPSATLRVNGSNVAQSTASQGAGNYGNYPLYIGARAGSSLWFNGRLYGLVIAGKQASASEIANTESWLNQKTGAY